MRSLSTNPRRREFQRPTSRKRIEQPIRAISFGVAPLAYTAATIHPALTPVMQWMGTLYCSGTFSTPACAMPRAKPPPSASPMRIPCVESAGGHSPAAGHAGRSPPKTPTQRAPSNIQPGSSLLPLKLLQCSYYGGGTLPAFLFVAASDSPFMTRTWKLTRAPVRIAAKLPLQASEIVAIRRGEGLDARVPSLNCMYKCKRFFAGVIAMWLVCACQVPSRAVEERRSNWTSVDAPCAKYDRLRKPLLGSIGVKIDVNGPWAEGFRRALRFWNTVLAVNFHEETNLGACSVRIINGGPDILNHAIVARAQITEWANFQGKIAVNPGSAKEISSAEIYAAAVHELGHMLGLKHNASIHSVMYFLDVDGTESLDSKDVLDLSMHHKLRPAIISVGFLPTQIVQPESASQAKAQAIASPIAN
jgi:Matrixin